MATVSPFDSRPDTHVHIGVVRGFLLRVVGDLLERAHVHDESKLHPPELELFDTYTPMLAGLEYGSEAYARTLREMAPALEHHYAANRHHPEHFENGIADMNLLDVIEMLADWKAASMRHDDGDLRRSIELNRNRFGYGDEIAALLLNTAEAFGWL